MSESDGSSAAVQNLNSTTETLEQLQQRHRKERKSLQNQITALKKRYAGDKKKKNELSGEIAILEKELKERQSQEAKELEKLQDSADSSGNISNEVSTNALSSNAISSSTEPPQPSERKRVNRQKLRQKRRAAREAEMRREAEEEAAAQPNMEQEEQEALRFMIESEGLSIHEVKPDGHCLYNAVVDQLENINSNHKYTFKQLRSLAANYMREHPDDFLPFLVNEKNGDMYTPDEYTRYCDDLERSAVWGGQLEIRALSETLCLPIYVYQSSSPILKIGEQHKEEGKGVIRVSYHRHKFGLGEHYNSLRRVVKESIMPP